MADRQRAGITGNATMRVPITGDVNVGGRAVRELRFMPRSAFPEVGRSDVLYIDTLGECIYYWNGGEYVQLSGGGSGTDNYNSLQNRPKINNVTLEGEQTSSDLGLQSSIDDLSSIRSGAAAGATAVQPSALTDYQTKLSGTNKLDPSYIDYDASHRAVSDTEKSTWNGKQDTISDLDTIRSGAAAGATALQQSDVSSTYSSSGTAPVNGTAVNAAIETLDVSSVGGSGKYISAISETDGKISATPTTFDTSLSSSSTNNNAPTSKTVYDDQQRQEVEIGAVANAGAKNLCPKETETSTSSGFTEDVEVNIPAGTYILSFTGTLAYTASLSLYRALPHSGNSLANINLSATTGTQSIEFTISETAKYIAFYHNGSGNSLTNIMIRPASITDNTFVPYAKTNRELTVAEGEDRAALIEQVNNGVKNLLRNTASSQVVGGVTFTVNADGTITANGTKTNNDWFYLSVGNKLKADTYVLSSGLAPQSDMSLRLLITTEDSLGSAIMSAEGGRQVHTKQLTSDYTGLYYAIRISSGTTVNNVVFKPMICTAADWAISQKFVPYAPTNRELYEMIQALQNNS